MGFFEIFGRIVAGGFLTLLIMFILFLVGSSAGEHKWWKAIGVGLWIWLAILAMSLGIFSIYAEIFGPFVQALF